MRPELRIVRREASIVSLNVADVCADNPEQLYLRRQTGMRAGHRLCPRLPGSAGRRSALSAGSSFCTRTFVLQVNPCEREYASSPRVFRKAGHQQWMRRRFQAGLSSRTSPLLCRFNHLLHNLGIDPPPIVFRNPPPSHKTQAAIKLPRGSIVLRHFQAQHASAFLLHLLFRGLHQQCAQAAASLDRVDIQGDDVAGGAPVGSWRAQKSQSRPACLQAARQSSRNNWDGSGNTAVRLWSTRSRAENRPGQADAARPGPAFESCAGESCLRHIMGSGNGCL